MSSSRHPIALSLERLVDGPTRLLAIVMALPLVDGLFPALVLAGALDSAVGILEVGLLIFGGSATLAVIIAEMGGSRASQTTAVLGVGALLLPVAGLEAALAPTFETVLDLAVFERFAAVVILAVAAQTASARIGEYIPRPAVIVGLGLLASLDVGAATLAIQAEPGLVLRGMAAAAVGVCFALAVALSGPWLRNAVDLDRFRFGSAVALGVLPLSIFGVLPDNAPLALAVLGVAALFALDPGRAREPEWAYRPDEIDVTAAMADGGSDDEKAGPEQDRIERLPWL